MSSTITITPATTVQQILAAMPVPPLTTAKEGESSPGIALNELQRKLRNEGYVVHNAPVSGKTWDGTAVNGFYYVEAGKGIPPPGPNPSSGGAVGWTVIFTGPPTGSNQLLTTPASGEPPIFKTRIVGHKKGPSANGVSYDAFQFKPDVKPLTSNNGYEIWFAPNATTKGGGRRGRGSRRSRRKGSRRRPF